MHAPLFVWQTIWMPFWCHTMQADCAKTVLFAPINVCRSPPAMSMSRNGVPKPVKCDPEAPATPSRTGPPPTAGGKCKGTCQAGECVLE